MGSQGRSQNRKNIIIFSVLHTCWQFVGLYVKIKSYLSTHPLNELSEYPYLPLSQSLFSLVYFSDIDRSVQRRRRLRGWEDATWDARGLVQAHAKFLGRTIHHHTNNFSKTWLVVDRPLIQTQTPWNQITTQVIKRPILFSLFHPLSVNILTAYQWIFQ